MREPIIPQLDAETYLMWESRQKDRFELRHGFVLAFAGGTIDHNQISRNLCSAFERLYPSPCRVFGSDVKVQVDIQTFFYPDAGVIRGEVLGTERSVGAPLVVAEVLSPSTRAYDVIEKRAAYRSMPSVQAYIVVHTDSKRIEVDLRGRDGAWSTAMFDDESIPLGSGFLTFDEVYARTHLLDAS